MKTGGPAAGDDASLAAPNRTLIVDDRGTSWSERKLTETIAAAAERVERAFAPEHRAVAVVSDNSVAALLWTLAVRRAGRIEVPIDARLPRAVIGRRIADCGAASIDPRGSSVRFDETHANDRWVDAEPEAILWTGGTTDAAGDDTGGRGVLVRRGATSTNARAKLAAVPQTADDVRLTVLPITHAFARTCDLETWWIGGGSLALSLGRRAAEKMMPSVRPTLMSVTPSLARDWIREPPSGLDRLRILGVGGAALDTDTFDAWTRRGVTVIQGYGMTETGPTVASATPDNAVAGCVGHCVDGVEFKVVDGELHVRGPSLLAGYLDATRTPFDADGFFRTGDLVELSEAGLRILGRKDDRLTLANGVTFDPVAIENELRTAFPDLSFVWVDADRHGSFVVWIAAGSAAHGSRIEDRVRRCRPELGRPRVRVLDPPPDPKTELTLKGTPRRNRLRCRVGR